MSQYNNGVNLRFINFLMKQINDHSDDIYESLVDKQYNETLDSSKKLISILDELNKSLEDDLETKIR